MNVPRLHPEHLRMWRSAYEQILAGDYSYTEAEYRLRRLGFANDALRIELLELERQKREARGPALRVIKEK